MAAKLQGRRPNTAERNFLADLAAELSDRPQATTAIIAGQSSRLGELVSRAFPAVRVVRVDNQQTASAVHVALAADGPYDVIVDDVRAKRSPVERFQRFFGHLKEGGALVARTGDERLRDHLTRLCERRSSEPLPELKLVRHKAPRVRELVLAHSVSRVEAQERHVVVESQLGFLAKMRERQMNHLIDVRRSSAARVLDRRPETQFESRCQLRENDGHHNDRMLGTFHVPELSLREYANVTCAPGQVVVQRNLLLPDTYRHNQRPRLRNQYTQDQSPLFARPRTDLSQAVQQAGPYYYLDSEFRGHFGHMMTEVMSRFWGWSEAKREHPDLKALVTVTTRPVLGAFETAMFKAAGIGPEDVFLSDRPVEVETLFAATPMFSMWEYVHPDIATTWAQVGDSLVREAPVRDYPKRIFCGRQIKKRPCRNAPEVESLFSRHGFTIIYPEEFPLAEQVKIFREADVVAGFAGSGMFTLALAASPKHAVIVMSETYRATNDYMIASVLGHQLDIVWCPLVADDPDSLEGKSRFHAEFELDFARDGDYVRDLLESL